MHDEWMLGRVSAGGERHVLDYQMNHLLYIALDISCLLDDIILMALDSLETATVQERKYS